MNASDPAAEAVAYWLEKAQEALVSARAEKAAGRFDFAVNRAYYAAYYAASAVLLARGRRFVKHTGVRGGVHRDLVKAGLLAPEWGRAFDPLFESRQRADYLALVRIATDEADQLITDAEGCVAAMRRLTEDKGQRAGRNEAPP